MHALGPRGGEFGQDGLDQSLIFVGAVGVGPVANQISAVARAFAREGALVWVSGRRAAPVESLAGEIHAAGGSAYAAEVDALDEQAVSAHVDQVRAKCGRVDISFNAIGIPQAGIQGVPLTALPLESFERPLATYARAHFLSARANLTGGIVAD